MFCPKCATQNLEGASFCRICGANISLVPQALTGQVPQTTTDKISEGRRRNRRHSREATLDHSIKNIFMGVAFLIIAVAISRSIGYGWWYWMLIPAFSLMGKGVAEFIRLKESAKPDSIGAGPVTRTFQERATAAPVGGLSAPNTGELLPTPPSVTEGTTRHLGAEAPTRHLDAAGDKK